MIVGQATSNFPMEQWDVTSQSRDLVDRFRRHVPSTTASILGIPWRLLPARDPFHLSIGMVDIRHFRGNNLVPASSAASPKATRWIIGQVITGNAFFPIWYHIHGFRS